MSEVSKPVSNPALVEAIQTARQQTTEENWAAMVREATRARFITPVDLSPAETGAQERSAKREPSFSLHMIEDSASGQRFYLAFTDWEELGKWRKSPGQRVLILTFDDYLRIVLDGKMRTGGFIINPYGGNVVLSRAMLEAVRRERDGRSPERLVMEKGTTLQLGLPAENPDALTGAIAAYLETQANVEAAYLQLMEVEGTPSYLVVVDFTGDRKALFHGISAAASGALSDLPLDLVSCESDFWRETTLDLEPFYKRP